MVQGAWRSWRNQPNQAGGLVVAVAAQYPFDRVTAEVAYPGDKAAGALRQAASVSEWAYGVLRWEVVRVEPQPEREWLVPVLIRSPYGKAWATGSGWDMVIDLHPREERSVRAVRC